MSSEAGIENKNLIAQLSKAVEQIKYGYIELVIQNSKVIQINRTEKIRLKDENLKIENR